MFRVLLIFSFLLAAVSPLLAADPSEQFLSAYESYQQGENLERSGNTSDAINKYRFAQSLLLSISKTDPSWQKPVIEFRLKKTRESLARLQGMPSDANGSDTTLVTSPPSDSTPASPSSGEQENHGAQNSSVGPSISITPPSGSSTSAIRSTPTPSSSSESRRLRQMVEDLKGELQEANDALSAQKQRASDLENAEWAKKRSQLTNDLDVANRKISDLERDLKSRDSWGTELKQLQKKLNDAVADKLAVEEQSQGNEKKLLDENALLVKQLQETQSKIAITNDSKKKIEQLSQEVEQGKQAYAQLQAKLDHSEQTSRESLAKNDDLQKQVTEMTEKLVVAQKQAEVAAPLHEKLKELQAKVDKDRVSINHESALEADVQVLQEDRDRLTQKVAELGVAAAEASKVKGLTAETETLNKAVANLKEQLDSSDEELKKARADDVASSKLAANSYKVAVEAKKRLARNLDDTEADRAVLQEENKRLSEKIARASLLVVSLKSTADTVPSLTKDIEHLKNQLDNNSKALSQSQEKLVVTQKEESAALEEIQSKEHSAKSVTTLLMQQNKALQDELMTALGSVATSVDHVSQSATLQEQIKRLQEQVGQNAKDFAESQRQLTDLANAQPDQKKALDEKQKALADAQSQASKLQTQLADANNQLLALKQQGNQSASRVKELQNQLLERDSKIASLKNKSGIAGDDQLTQENELLRGIVMREIKDEAKKSQAHRLMDEELKRLNVSSDVLQQQMSELAAPAVQLTPQERALFKDAQLVVSDQGSENMEAFISAPMSAKGAAVETNGNATPNTQTSNSQSNKSTDATPSLASQTQGKFKVLLSQAKDEFDRQDYLQAEETFQQALKLSPTDYFALSNYGVVEFQLGKMKEAEEALTKAVAQSTNSSFALTTLGIVHYRQQRPQDAETVLRKAVAINDQDFTAHNYLGIVLAASGKGKAGESELMKAVEINPNYADAHFNLAVIYATGKPPAKMLARKHYTKALELGSPPDASLDRMLQ
jgi:Flp pilus assembly protein TadD/chromosome segregation ATPase